MIYIFFFKIENVTSACILTYTLLTKCSKFSVNYLYLYEDKKKISILFIKYFSYIIGNFIKAFAAFITQKLCFDNCFLDLSIVCHTKIINWLSNNFIIIYL